MSHYDARYKDEAVRDHCGRPMTYWGGFMAHYTKLLEHNPSPLTPWLTVQSAQDEIAILQVNEETIWSAS